MESLKEKVLELVFSFGPRLIAAILTLMIGIGLIKVIIRMVNKSLERSHIDKSVHSFIKSVLSFSLKVIVVIIAASMITDINFNSILAVISAAGLGIGLALKDSLSNLAGGILILIFKPFGVDDFIECEGYMGTVKEIQLLYTSLNTIDNRRITIPNNELANGKIVNYSVEDTRRVDLTFSTSYDDDINKVQEVLKEIVDQQELAFKNPEPVIKPIAYGDSSIDFTVRMWCKSEDYWTIYYNMFEIVKERFDKEGITIPFNESNINVYQESQNK